MEVNNYLRKFKLLLDSVNEGKIVLSDNDSERIIKLLEDGSDNSTVHLLLHTPSFSDIIYNCMENFTRADRPIQVFLLKLMTILLKNELQFSKFQLQGVKEILGHHLVLKTIHTAAPPIALHVASIKIATALISHCSGLKLLYEQKIWEYILIPNIHQKPIKLANAAYEFISKLVWTLNDCNKESELIEVLGFINDPIKTSEYLQLQDLDPDVDKRCNDKIYSYLKTLSVILSETDNILAENKVVPLLKKSFIVEHYLYKIARVTRIFSVIHITYDILWRIFISTTHNILFNGEIEDFCNITVAHHHNLIINLFLKRSLPFIIDYVIQLNVIWSHFESSMRKKKPNLQFPLTFERNGRKLLLRNQFIIHMAVPLMAYSYIERAITEVEIEQLNATTWKSVTEHIYSSCYLLKCLVYGHDVKQITIHAIKELCRLKGHIITAQAGIIFLSLYYTLGIYIASDGTGGLILDENPIKTPDDVKLLSSLLNALQMLLKEHNISWYDCVEIATIQERLMNLLKQNILQSTLQVQVLNLINLCVKKFLSPSMTLLVETKQGTALTDMGAIMKMYIQHDEWEVRDSALDLLLTCIDIAFVKYVPLQAVINENQLMVRATRVAITDPEFYPRTTALKCLVAATKVESVWRNIIIHNSQIHMQLFNIVRNNPEGMVRKEAVNVLRQIYVTQNVSQTFKNYLYGLMVTTALNDLHWEVQLETLKFWDDVIKSHLTYRGMIDGKFPAVTFSKEKRKIVVLNEKEIKRILACIMNDLSSIGCFTVLLECMDKDNNIEVMEQAYTLANELIKVLDHHKYQVLENTMTYSEEYMETKERVEDMAVNLSYAATNEDLRNNIIESILNTQQSELLIDLHDRLNDTRPFSIEQVSVFPRKEKVNPNKFIETFKGTDYLSIIEAKKNWNAKVDTLDDLLNDILTL